MTVRRAVHFPHCQSTDVKKHGTSSNDSQWQWGWDISRVLHASTATVIKELKKEPAVANRQSETVESAATRAGGGSRRAVQSRWRLRLKNLNLTLGRVMWVTWVAGGMRLTIKLGRYWLMYLGGGSSFSRSEEITRTVWNWKYCTDGWVPTSDTFRGEPWGGWKTQKNWA